MVRKCKPANVDDKEEDSTNAERQKRAKQQVSIDLLLVCLWYGNY